MKCNKAKNERKLYCLWSFKNYNNDIYRNCENTLWFLNQKSLFVSLSLSRALETSKKKYEFDMEVGKSPFFRRRLLANSTFFKKNKTKLNFAYLMENKMKKQNWLKLRKKHTPELNRFDNLWWDGMNVLSLFAR